MSLQGWWLYLSISFLFGASYCTNCSYNDVHVTYPSSSVRPVKNWTTPTVIGVNFYLISVVSLNMNLQSITTVGYLEMNWNNEFITWSKNESCGIEYMYVARNKLWQPDLYVYERIENDDKSQINPFYNVTYIGNIQDSRSIRIVSSCKLDIFKFPFDTQKCNISFGSYIYTVRDLKIINSDNSSELFNKKDQYFMSKGDWDLINIAVSTADYTASNVYSKVSYMFTIKRVSEVYVLTFIIPVYFMVVLDMISMFIQMDKADRLGFKITLVLGFAMLLLILNDILPLSDTPPLLGVFCCVCMAAMLCSILGSIGTIYILNMYKKRGIIPPWVNSILLKRLSDLLCLKRTIPLDVENAEPQENSAGNKKTKISFELGGENEDSEGQLDIPLEVEILQSLLSAIQNIHKSLTDSKQRNIAKSQCSLAANVVDRLILIVYTLIMTVLSIYVIVIWASN